MTELKPSWMERWQTGMEVPWSWCMHTGMCGNSSMAARIRWRRKGAPAYLRAPAEAWHDHRGVGLVGGLHDGAHLLQVVDVEGGDAVAVLGGVVQQLTHGNQGHGRFSSCLAVGRLVRD